LNFPECRIVLRVDREIRSRVGRVLSCDSRYFATSLAPGSVAAAGLQSYVRDHWQVENCLHFVKDRWWDEDRHYTKRPGLAECRVDQRRTEYSPSDSFIRQTPPSYD
jgi:hypothetical protein